MQDNGSQCLITHSRQVEEKAAFKGVNSWWLEGGADTFSLLLILIR